MTYNPAAGGASAFDGLTDTPANKTGQVGKIVAVASGETTLEYIAAPSGAVDLTAGTEVASGRDIDSQPTYFKRISLGTLPNAATSSVVHGITGLVLVIGLEGNAKDGTGDQIPLPHTNVVGGGVSVVVDASKIYLNGGEDDWSGYTGYLNMEYTKT